MPQLLVFSTIQPVIFVLLFRYVFGGAIHHPGRRLRRLPHAGDLRPDRDVRRHPDGHRPRRGPATRGSSSGSVRCRWRVPRCWPGARSPTSMRNVVRRRADGRRRVPGRLPRADRRAGLPRRCPRDPALRLLVDLDLRHRSGSRRPTPRPPRRCRSRSSPRSCSPPRRSSASRRCRDGCRPSPSTSRSAMAVDAVRSLMLGGQFHDTARVLGRWPGASASSRCSHRWPSPVYRRTA